MKINTLIGQLRLLAILEGISYLSFAITVPLKRFYSMPEPNLYVGRLHGMLFIMYVIWVLVNKRDQKWDTKTTVILLIASLIPFGTFWAEVKYMKEKKPESTGK